LVEGLALSLKGRSGADAFALMMAAAMRALILAWRARSSISESDGCGKMLREGIDSGVDLP
jgi:hypothetical protein